LAIDWEIAKEKVKDYNLEKSWVPQRVTAKGTQKPMATRTDWDLG